MQHKMITEVRIQKVYISFLVTIIQSINTGVLLRRFKNSPKKVLFLRIDGEESLTSSIFLRLSIAGRTLDSSSRKTSTRGKGMRGENWKGKIVPFLRQQLFLSKMSLRP